RIFSKKIKTFGHLCYNTPRILFNYSTGQMFMHLCGQVHASQHTVADAILDRIIHSSHRIELEGESMRKLRSKINKI
ncbi:ATP-binding protein, partial [Aliarcobacter sp.]|uniref:ATP-binding protein n=1 Tax=Aliarcobacter sp. TaxID=2321116 RepID=UPI003563C9CA